VIKPNYYMAIVSETFLGNEIELNPVLKLKTSGEKRLSYTINKFKCVKKTLA
jgi:hypothetical protein